MYYWNPTGSILSPFLYSPYINSLPALLRRRESELQCSVALSNESTNDDDDDDDDFQPVILPQYQQSNVSYMRMM